jgi:hypothetical protein
MSSTVKRRVGDGPNPQATATTAAIASTLSAIVYIAICAWGLARCNYEREKGSTAVVASLGYFIAMLITFFLFPPASFIMAIVAVAILGPTNQ